MLNGFKNFILKGNVVDLAVAVVIGAAFGAVVTALVQSVLMPFIAGLVGSPNFDSFAVVTLNGNDIKFGVLLTAIVNFLLVAAAIYFVVVVPMNHMIERRNRRLGINPDVKEEAAEDPQIALLTEIRDALRADAHASSAATIAPTMARPRSGTRHCFTMRYAVDLSPRRAPVPARSGPPAPGAPRRPGRSPAMPPPP